MTRARRPAPPLVALLLCGLALTACGGDDTPAAAPPTDDQNATEGAEVIEVGPNESLTGQGPEIAVGSAGDFGGLVVTVTSIHAGDAAPVVPTAAGVVEVEVRVENTSSDEGVAPSMNVLCDDLGAGAGAAHPSDVLVEPIPVGATGSGSVTIDVPAGCGSPAVVVSRLAGGDPSQNPPVAHWDLPADATP